LWLLIKAASYGSQRGSDVSKSAGNCIPGGGNATGNGVVLYLLLASGTAPGLLACPLAASFIKKK